MQTITRRKSKSIKIEALKKMLPDNCVLQGAWKPYGEKPLRFSVYDYGNIPCIRAYYRMHIEMDYSGLITAVKNEHEYTPDLSVEFQHLVGKKVDLDSFKYYYEKEVNDSPSKMFNDTELRGLIQNGRFVPFTKRNAHHLKELLRPDYLGNNDRVEQRDHYEYAQLFMEFAKKHREHLKKFRMLNCHGTELNYTYCIDGKEIFIKLWQFFNYHLKICLYDHRNKRKDYEEDKAMKKLQKLLANV